MIVVGVGDFDQEESKYRHCADGEIVGEDEHGSEEEHDN